MNMFRQLPGLLWEAARATGRQAGHTGQHFRQLSFRALDAVQEVMRAEVRKGNVQQVVAFLRGTALPAARTLLLERITTRLLLRLGLRGALASNVVGWVLPLVLEKLVQAGQRSGLFDQLLAHDTMAESLRRLEELRRTAWKLIAPDAGSGAELLPDEPAPAAPSLGLPPQQRPGAGLQQ